jgi:hypothetical protein
MKMTNTPPNTGATIFTFNGYSMWYSYEYHESIDTRIIEKLIETLGNFDLTKCRYEDFGCSDRGHFIKKLHVCALELHRQKKNKLKRAKYGTWLYKIDHSEANMLAATDHHCRSRQSIQALMLAEKRSTYPRPSSFLIDSS